MDEIWMNNRSEESSRQSLEWRAKGENQPTLSKLSSRLAKLWHLYFFYWNRQAIAFMVSYEYTRHTLHIFHTIMSNQNRDNRFIWYASGFQDLAQFLTPINTILSIFSIVSDGTTSIGYRECVALLLFVRLQLNCPNSFPPLMWMVQNLNSFINSTLGLHDRCVPQK